MENTELYFFPAIWCLNRHHLTVVIWSNHSEVFCDKTVLKNFCKVLLQKFYLYQRLFYNKVAGWGLQLYWEAGSYTGSCEICKYFKNSFFIKRLWSLLLDHLLRYCESDCNMRLTIKNIGSKCEKIYEKLRFYFLSFHSRTFTIHRTVGERERYLLNSSLPLPPAS